MNGLDRIGYYHKVISYFYLPHKNYYIFFTKNNVKKIKSVVEYIMSRKGGKNMDSVFLITTAAFILAVILIIITIVIIKSNQSKKYKKQIENLDIEKNNLLGIPVLSEMTKVKELVKTDNLKEKMEDWDSTFKLIRDDKIPSLTDSISDVDFLVDRKDYKQAIRKIADIEMELRILKKKTNQLLILLAFRFIPNFLPKMTSQILFTALHCHIHVLSLA